MGAISPPSPASGMESSCPLLKSCWPGVEGEVSSALRSLDGEGGEGLCHPNSSPDRGLGSQLPALPCGGLTLSWALGGRPLHS
jgi:hypothetical protein